MSLGQISVLWSQRDIYFTIEIDPYVAKYLVSVLLVRLFLMLNTHEISKNFVSKFETNEPTRVRQDITRGRISSSDWYLSIVIRDIKWFTIIIYKELANSLKFRSVLFIFAHFLVTALFSQRTAHILLVKHWSIWWMKQKPHEIFEIFTS